MVVQRWGCGGVGELAVGGEMGVSWREERRATGSLFCVVCAGIGWWLRYGLLGREYRLEVGGYIKKL